MSGQTVFDYPWVIFTQKNTLFGISAKDVQSMVNTPPVVEIPHTPHYVRGVVNLRGRVVPLIDLRARLGMSSFLDQIESFCSIMDQREQDHKNWLAELEASVKESREFKLTTDPHKCAFGKWYDDYKPETYALASLLRKFDVPHRKIHAIAEKVKSLEEEGNIQAAQQIIDECRDVELAEMIKLFDQVRKAYRAHNNEITIVLAPDSQLFAVTADTVETIETLAEGSIEDIPECHIELGEKGLITSTGRRLKGNELVLLLDHIKIAEGLAMQKIAAT